MNTVPDLQETQEQFFEVRLDVFDGPIDLLLHLVKQNELPIEKVSLAEVASQYMEYLEAMRNFDLEIAGEYLVIATTLLSIKSSILLNKPVEFVLDEDGQLVDPHEQLLARLREAEIYKEGAQRLALRDVLGVDVWAPPSSLQAIAPAAVQYQDHDPLLLGRAFKRLLEQIKEDPAVVISVDRVSIVERMMSILAVLQRRGGSVRFGELVTDITSRAALVSCFLALLELCKRHVIRITQEIEFDDISIKLNGGTVDSSLFTSSAEYAADEPQPVSVNA